MRVCKKFGIGFLIFGIVFLVILWTDIRIVLSDPIDLCSGQITNVKQIHSGVAVETEMDSLLDGFMTVETTHKNRSGQVTGKDYDNYYIMPVLVGSETYYIAFCVDQEDAWKYQSLLGRVTGSYFTSGREIELSGGLYKLKKKYYNYMVDWFEETDFFANDADIEKYVLPVVLKPIVIKNVKIMVMVDIIAIALGIIFLSIGILGGKSIAQRDQAISGLGTRSITINGFNYRVADMGSINQLILNGEIDKARKKLMKTYKASEMEANQIIANWGQITAM